MPERWFHIQPLDPLLIRDARPFQSVPGIRARSLNDVPPSVVAGTLRTALAKKRQSIKHTTPLSYYAKSLVRGPLYRWHDHLYVPMPNDLELFDDEYGMNQVRPKPMMSKGQGFYGTGKTGRFSEALWPPVGAGARKKMKSPPAFVSLKWMVNWLTDAVDESQVKEALTEYQHIQKENHSFKRKHHRHLFLHYSVRNEHKLRWKMAVKEQKTSIYFQLNRSYSQMTLNWRRE